MSSESKKSVKFDESSIAQTPSRKASKIDWLGIGGEEEHEETATSSSRTNDVDWLTSGLSRRQQRRASGSRNEDERPATSQSTKSKTPEKSAPNPVDKIADKNENDLVNSAGEERLKSSEFDGELTVLRTKVSILEIEKLHLSESIDKLNTNHEQEVNLLKQLHE